MSKLRVAIMDITQLDGYECPVGNMFGSSEDANEDHANIVCEEFLRQFTKSGEYTEDDVEIFGLKYTQTSWIWLKNQNESEESRIHILIMSLNDWLNSTLFSGSTLEIEEEVAKNTILLTSSGNSGDDGETGAAQRDVWISVGAMDLDGDIRSSSSYGLECVDICAYQGYDGHYGTSYANPNAAGTLGNYFLKYRDAQEDNTFPSADTARKWIFYNTPNDEYDIQEGWGLFELPEKWRFEPLLPSDDRYIMMHDDGRSVSVNVNDKERIKILEDEKGFYKYDVYTNPSAE